MLFVIDEASKPASKAQSSSFAELTLRERFDIQEWVVASPQILGEDLLIVTTEFDQFDKTAERLDVLAIDQRGKLVIIELKRTAVGTRADLQALRYAAYCSTLGIDDIAELHAAHVRRRHQREINVTDARQAILAFVDDPAFEELDDKPRIILAAEEFPAEITATLLWLRTFGLGISAVRLRPYRVGSNLLVDCSVIIPLPEAKDFIVRRERKEVRQAARARGKGEAYLPWFQSLLDDLRDVHAFTNARAAQPQNWYSFASGISRVTYAVVFAQQGLRAELYLDPGEKDVNKSAFDKLLAARQEIEGEFGDQLSWERLDDRRASRVGVYYPDITIASPPEELEVARAWSIEKMLRFRKVFSPRLERILR